MSVSWLFFVIIGRFTGAPLPIAPSVQDPFIFGLVAI